MHGITDKQKGIFAYIIVCLIWGSNFLATRVLVISMPPLIFSGTRFISAGLITLFILYIRKLSFSWRDMNIERNIIVGLLTIYGGNGLFVYGMQSVQSGEAALLTTTIPLFIGIIQIVFPNSQRSSVMSWLGLLIGFGGVAFLLNAEGKSPNFSLVGSTIILTSAMVWAAGTVYFNRIPGKKNIMAQTGVQMIVGGLAQTVTGVFLGEVNRISLPVLKVSGIIAYFYLLIFGGIVGFAAYNYLMQVWPAEKAGTYAYITPVVALILGSMFLGESLTVEKIGSALIILFGVYLVQISVKTESKVREIIK